jgi:hypothetical protein
MHCCLARRNIRAADVQTLLNAGNFGRLATNWMHYKVNTRSAIFATTQEEICWSLFERLKILTRNLQ